MPARHPSRLPASLILAVALTAACGGGGVDGKYYNTASGEFAFELKGGKVIGATGMMSGLDLVYQVKGDSLYLGEKGGSKDDTMVFGVKPGGVLDLGIMGSLTKK